MNGAASGLLDLIYPPKCLVCEAIGEEPLCRECAAEIVPVPRPYCPICGSPVWKHCSTCHGRINAYAAARAVGEYSGVLRSAIQALKYKGHRMLALPLARLLYTYLTERADYPWERAELIVPVPVHAVRKRIRGYNQSELLAESLSELTGLPCVPDAVARIRQTVSQVELSGDDRRINLRGAFAAKAEVVRNKTVLLVDDVFTTASTVHECAYALRQAGALRVYVAALACGLPSKQAHDFPSA